VREADRPIELRVSVLDRPRADTDALPEPMAQHMLGNRLDEESVRLGLVVGECNMYVARGEDEEEIFQFLRHSTGGGSAGGNRSTFATHGALVCWNSGGDGRCIAYGVVPDSVIAVRVDGVEAVLANNAYVAAVPSPGGEVVLVTADGEREFPRPPTLRPLRSVEESAAGPEGRGYLGMVEYAWSGMTDLEIDDLDIPNWHGTPAGALLLNSAPDVWPVGVVLLEGPRSGELALADMVVQRDATGATESVEFVGRTAFGPHPDPPRLDAALQRLRELRGRF
jgi:hypothetical protein